MYGKIDSTFANLTFTDVLGELTFANAEELLHYINYNLKSRK